MRHFFEMDIVLRPKMLGLFCAAVLVGTGLPAHAGWEVAQAQAVGTAQPAIQSRIGGMKPFYQITAQDVGEAVAEQLVSQGLESKAEATLSPGSPSVLYSSDHAIKISLHALQVDPKSKRWQAQVYFLNNGQTESVRPVAGTYTRLIEVPVVGRQLTRMDVIEEKDISFKVIPERLLRKDTILDPKQLVGLSPRNGITANRPINAVEITAPIVIKRGDLVEMVYHTPYIHIKATGLALEDGAKGSTIRIKNQKSQLAVSARVEGAGKVSVSNGETL
jgi:flagellar basal body P-ring formation protein FlgA